MIPDMVVAQTRDRDPSATTPGFEQQSYDIIKSVQQRWLLMIWSRQRNDGAAPLSDSFDLAQIDPCRDDLSVFDVLPHNGAHRLRIYAHGRNVGRMYASECAGKFLDELLPEESRTPMLATYEHVIHARRPVYTTSRLTDAENRPILYERLLLPLLGADGSVVRILALLETISAEGTIERNSLMTGPRSAPSFSLRAELNVP